MNLKREVSNTNKNHIHAHFADFSQSCSVAEKTSSPAQQFLVA